MKKLITGAIVVMALMSGMIVNGQVTPPGGGVPPPPGPPGAGSPPPPAGAQLPGPRGPEAALQAVTVFQGKVTKLSANDEYIYDGFYLQTGQDSVMVKFPGRLGTQITALIKVGSTVTVNGAMQSRPSGEKEVRMVSLTVDGKTVYDSPPSVPATPPADNFVNGNAKVVGTQTDREGRINGLLLDNKTVLRVPPGTAGQLSGLVKDGSLVGYSGMQKIAQAGEVAVNDMKIVHCNTISLNGQQFLVR